jgi:hypothetical protein
MPSNRVGAGVISIDVARDVYGVAVPGDDCSVNDAGAAPLRKG